MSKRDKTIIFSVFSFALLLLIIDGTYILFSENVKSVINGEKLDLKNAWMLSTLSDISNLENENNDNYQNANRIYPNVEYAGDLYDSYDNGEEDWYFFSLPKGGSVSITLKTIGQNDEANYWNITLREAKDPGTRVQNDYIAGTTTNYRSAGYYRGAGDYYFEIESSNKYSGDIYTFVINYDDSYEEFVGSYVVDSGLADANLIYSWDGEGDFTAYFNFYANSTNPAFARGRYLMKGRVLESYDDGSVKVDLIGDEWLEQPEGYSMASFTVILNREEGTLFSDDRQLNMIREDLLRVSEDSYRDNLVEFNGHTYCFFDRPLSWNNAERFCNNIGGHLVSINGPGEQEFIQSIADSSGKDYIWLGAYLDGDTWRWTDESEFSYFNWDTDRPDNAQGKEGFAKLSRDDFDFETWSAHRGKWDDVSLVADGLSGDVPLSSFGFICEWNN